MFAAAVTFLVCMAVLVVIWVDMPGLQERANALLFDETAGLESVDAGLDDAVTDDAGPGESATAVSSSAEPNAPSTAEPTFGFLAAERFVLGIMVIVWIMVLAESVWHWVTRPWNDETRKHHWFSVFICVCPALRMCARSPEMKDRIWLPVLGWRKPGRRLQRQLERYLSLPMMGVALLILPILIIEFFLKDQVAEFGWLRWLLHVGTGVIWFAFAAEFILMVSIAEKKLEYCKKHWVDLAIILIPIVSFLRSLSILRMARLSNVVRLQQLAKFARMYRLRGTALKLVRVLVLFDLTERLLGISDETRIARLETELQEVEKRARLLRQKIARLRLQKDTDNEESTI